MKTYEISTTQSGAFDLCVYMNHEFGLSKTFKNQYDAIDWLEENGLFEKNGDFYYDPIKHTFRFSDSLSEMQYRIGD